MTSENRPVRPRRVALSGLRISGGGKTWRWARIIAQTVVLIVVVAAPVLGGWQRLDEESMASWNTLGRELPATLYKTLPRGHAPSKAYDALQLVGGGTGVDVLGIPAIDPVAGSVALLRGRFDARVLLAFALPLLIGLFAGRFFCGWLCPYGTIARWLDAALRRLRWTPLFVVPTRRPIRWLVLGVAIVGGALGGHMVVDLALPHLLVQQASYAVWLLGGGSAVLGLLVGLIATAVAFGPTTWCSALCPTGAMLSATGRARVVRVAIARPSACGKSCGLCSVACWLHLDPASGDPGPDCDACARCFTSCPSINLQVVVAPPRRASAAAICLAAMAVSFIGGDARAEETDRRPRLTVSAHRVVGDVTVAVAAVDMTGTRDDADHKHEQRGTDISVFIVRGAIGAPDERGVLPTRDTYDAKLDVRIVSADGTVLKALNFDRARRPRSAPRPTIYRERIYFPLTAGMRIEVLPVQDWLTDVVSIPVPKQGGTELGAIVPWGVLGFLLYGGSSVLALAIRERDPVTSPVPR